MNCKTCGHDDEIHIGGKGDCLEYVLRNGQRALCDCALFVKQDSAERSKP